MAFSSLRSRVIPLCHRSFSAKPSYRRAKGRGTPVIDSDNETSEEDVPISGISRLDFPELRDALKDLSPPVFPYIRNPLEESSSSSSSRADRDKEGLMFDSDKQTQEDDVPTSGISRLDFPELRDSLKKLGRAYLPDLRNRLQKASSPSYSSRADRDKEGLMFDSDKQTPEGDVPTSGISRPVFPELRNQLKKASSSSSSSSSREDRDKEGLMFDSDKQTPQDDVPTSGISRPLSEILKELNKKVPDSLIKYRHEPNGVSLKYIPWHIMNRIMNLHAPEWSGEVRSVTHSPDGKSVSVVYRVTIYGTDAEIYRESTGTASVDDPGYGDPVQKAEGMAFRRACARFGLGLHLYHEDMS